MHTESKYFDPRRLQGSLTISELLYILSCIKEKYGDIEVYIDENGYETRINDIDFSEMFGKKCVVLGG